MMEFILAYLGQFSADDLEGWFEIDPDIQQWKIAAMVMLAACTIARFAWRQSPGLPAAFSRRDKRARAVRGAPAPRPTASQWDGLPGA